ncbi:MAG: cytochrome c oxidase subunit 3 [Saprospiraceae bacterium]|jgi:cytochrome c oxidase subunit 3
MSNSSDNNYYVPHGTNWPIIGSIGLSTLAWGFINVLNESASGKYVMMVGAAILIYMFFGWFAEVIRESEANTYKAWEDKSFRLGMTWFIFSEVMFFAAFFGALYYTRMLSVPWLGGAGDEMETNRLLWDGWQAVWPTNGPGAVGGDYQAMSWKGLPLINTIILLTSGFTLTWAHHALKHNNRKSLIIGLALTVGLGFLFVGLQAIEYIEAYHTGLTMGSGVYGSTFFMLTGFHGFHVCFGAIMLTVVLFRAMKGHFTSESHFAFEGAAWYWHFVDVVWLGLFVFVYIL